MERDSRNKEECCPRLLHLIHKDKDWIVRENERNFGRVSEEKKLELKLGPPGGEESWFLNENHKNEKVDPSFEGFSSMASNTHNKNQNHNLFSSMETHQGGGGSVFSHSWCSGSLPSPSTSQIKTQQQFHQYNSNNLSYAQFQTNPQNFNGKAKETVELQKNHTQKKACFLTSDSPANTAATNNSQKRTAPASVVGWPPIRSFRKKSLSNNSPSKPTTESENGDLPKVEENQENCRKSFFVKINMDGVPIGRKVDLRTYDSYEKLSSAVDELFRTLLAAQRETAASDIQSEKVVIEAITGLLDESGEYTLVYEDNEGDRMLVGDVPWDMFVSTVKRLRVLKSSEVSELCVGSSKQEKMPVESTTA